MRFKAEVGLCGLVERALLEWLANDVKGGQDQSTATNGKKRLAEASDRTSTVDIIW